MKLTTDAVLKGPVWAETLDRLDPIFKTYWDVYALSISIGMMYDQQIEADMMVPEGYVAEPKSVPRTVLGHTQNKALLEFMLQAAMVTTKHLNLSEDERLEVAFGEEEKLGFNPIVFLTKYANYGITKIKEAIDDAEDVELLTALMTLLNGTYEAGFTIMEDDNESEGVEFDDE